MNRLNELFEHVVVINLEWDYDRLQVFSEHADAVNLDWERFEGIPHVDGRTGCKLSHKAVLEKYRSVFIFEDDAKIPMDFEKKLDDLVLPEDLDVLFLGCGLERGTRENLGDWIKIGTGFYGTWAWGVMTTNGHDHSLSLISKVPDGIHWDTAARRLGGFEAVNAYRPHRNVTPHCFDFPSNTKNTI